MAEEPPASRELSEYMRELNQLLAEEGVDAALDLDGLLTVCDLTMDDPGAWSSLATSHDGAVPAA